LCAQAFPLVSYCSQMQTGKNEKRPAVVKAAGLFR